MSTDAAGEGLSANHPQGTRESRTAAQRRREELNSDEGQDNGRTERRCAMPKLSEVMTRDVITVTPETTLREAVELFTAKHISGAPVVSGREVVGVVSASDILEFAAFAADLAKEPSEPSSWSSAASEAEEETLNEVPGSYYTDLYAGQAADVANRIDSPSDANVLDAHTVDEVMTRSEE